MPELGTISACWTVRFERGIPQAASRLWEAITRADQVEAWWGSPARIDLRVGGAWRVDFGGDDALDGVIVRLEPQRRLAVVWGLSVLEWEIAPESRGCHYTFVHHGQTPGLAPDEGGLAAGWHAFLDNIERLLDGTPYDATTHRDLTPLYRERIEAILSP